MLPGYRSGSNRLLKDSTIDWKLEKLEDTRMELTRVTKHLNDYIYQLLHTYIPRKSDSIDQELARSINQFPEKDKMKIMFLRQSEGVYKFGSK